MKITTLVCCVVMAGLPLQATSLSAVKRSPLLPSDFMRGVNHVSVRKTGHGYGSVVSAHELMALRNNGVRWVALMPLLHQEGRMASEVRLGKNIRQKDAELLKEIKIAHRLGMKILLKPEVWSDDFWNGAQWSGTIEQADEGYHQIWWESYRKALLHYATFAQTQHVEMISIGTELVKMTTSPASDAEWRALIREMRRLYKGKLTYAAHWETEFENVSFWNALDLIGIDAFFPLDRPENVAFQELIKAWAAPRDRIRVVQARFKKPVAFLEIGYRSVKDAPQQPQNIEPAPNDYLIQQQAYDAFFKAMTSQPWWKGAFFWKTFTDPDEANESEDHVSYSFRNKPAQNVVRKWFIQ